jgi:hypothetical protein
MQYWAGMTRLVKWGLVSAAILVVGFGVFVLPFLIPPPVRQIVSVANSAGFNNRVAGLAAASASLLALIIFWRFRPPVRLPQTADCQPMSRRFVLGWSLGTTAITACGILLIYGAHVRYMSDYGYFIGQMSSAADYGRKLYSEIEFPYGPLLFYPPIWIQGLFRWCARPLAAAYCFTYIAEELGGLLLLAYVMQRLPIESQLRRWVFIAMALFSLSGGFGVNYTFFRFATPFAIFLFSLRGRRISVAVPLLLAGQLITLGISPEIGFGFGSASVGYALLRALRREFRWLALVPVPIVGFGLFLLVAGRGYLHVLSLFSGGAYSLIVEPQFFVLLYLASLIWLAPAGLAAWRRDNRLDADLLLGMYVLGVALVPAAFGRADLGHVVYNGLPILLLALIAVSAWRAPARLAWALVIFAVVLIGQRVDFTLYRQQLQYVTAAQIVERVPLDTRRRLAAKPLFRETNTGKLLLHESLSLPFDVDQVQEIVGKSKVAVPLQIPLEVEEALRQRDLYRPGFYLFEAGLFDRNSEERKIAEMNESVWALLPPRELRSEETVESTAFLLGIAFPYKERRPTYVVGSLLMANLRHNWHPVASVDSYTLYRRNW